MDRSSKLFVVQLDDLQLQWRDRYATFRAGIGATRQARADSATMRLLPLLSEVPVTTASSVQRLLNVSFPAARAALEELADAGVLARQKVERGTTAYFAREVFDLLTVTERQPASTRWDTRGSPSRSSPNRRRRSPRGWCRAGSSSPTWWRAA